jgi:TetR/AcrR family transcriptional repressor of nem operon
MTGRPREFERDEALDKAMDLFWSQGYEATRVAQLCAHMGVGRQSLYNTFGDKESLFTEALTRYKQLRLEPMITGLRGPGSGLENVRRLLEGWDEASTDVAHKG